MWGFNFRLFFGDYFFDYIKTIRFDLELFDHLCGDIVISVVQNKIRFHIENTSIDNYHESFIKSFEQVNFVKIFI